MRRSVFPAALLGGSALLTALAACAGDSRNTARDSSAMGAAATAADSAQPSAAGGATAQSGMLDPNAASREELGAVPAMTPAAADALVAGRPYENMVAVDRVLARHLGEPQRDTVYARVWKPVDLNSASGDEILLIPGVGPRMRHEFEEYRPYRSIERFRREIGKYVDKSEVARLERYVTIR
ncbi:MAG TPA: hypothetical protein VNA89_14330 [Gemmatimonadaceae bacterium]|nr:hypothetical protein [Gemmatimonadaceae bacterium]